MPVVLSFDGVNRRITLDPSVANGTWSPLDVFKEYLAYRRDTHQFRGFEPLIRMRGGEPKGAGKSAPRFLQMLTDSRGITSKFVLPDSGPYRTKVDGEIATDVPDTDPEPFDLSGLTTSGIVIDYKPAEAEIITVATGSGLSPAEQALLNELQAKVDELWRLDGLDSGNPMTVTPTSRVAGDITQVITGDGENTTTVTRQ